MHSATQRIHEVQLCIACKVASGASQLHRSANGLAAVLDMEVLYRSLLDSKDSTIPWADLQAALRTCRDIHEATEEYQTVLVTGRATLHKCDLWREFHSITNEMIVTKAGR